MACNPGLTYKYEYTGASIECASPGHNNQFTNINRLDAGVQRLLAHGYEEFP
jgi:hypothetical protein